MGLKGRGGGFQRSRRAGRAHQRRPDGFHVAPQVGDLAQVKCLACAEARIRPVLVIRPDAVQREELLRGHARTEFKKLVCDLNNFRVMQLNLIIINMLKSLYIILRFQTKSTTKTVVKSCTVNALHSALVVSHLQRDSEQ